MAQKSSTQKGAPSLGIDAEMARRLLYDMVSTGGSTFCGGSERRRVPQRRNTAPSASMPPIASRTP